MAPPKRKLTGYAGIIQAISTPLSLYVLILLVIESMTGLVLTYSKLTEEHVWTGFYIMIGMFLLVFLMVSGLVIFAPTKLLYGKEEHANPMLEPSALRDQIEDLIAANVKRECLKNADDQIG